MHMDTNISHYCLTMESNDITALVSGEQKHYFHLWGLQKPLVIFSVPTHENNVFLLSFHCTVILLSNRREMYHMGIKIRAI
jgi:hypothetical protein